MTIRADSPASTARYTSLIHSLDHMERMSKLVIHQLNDVRLTNHLERIYPLVLQLEELILESIEALQKNNAASIVPKLSLFSQDLSEFRKKERAEIFKVAAKGEADIAEAFEYVNLILFVDGVSYHLWRLMHHTSE